MASIQASPASISTPLLQWDRAWVAVGNVFGVLFLKVRKALTVGILAEDRMESAGREGGSNRKGTDAAESFCMP